MITIIIIIIFSLVLDNCPWKKYVLQDIVNEIILGKKNSVQGPLLLQLLFAGLETMSQSIH